VRWKGYIVEENTWENRKNLENAKELVEELGGNMEKRVRN